MKSLALLGALSAAMTQPENNPVESKAHRRIQSIQASRMGRVNAKIRARRAKASKRK